jgi:hypothetical protein
MALQAEWSRTPIPKLGGSGGGTVNRPVSPATVPGVCV